MEWISVKDSIPTHGKRVLMHEVTKPEWEHLSVIIGWLRDTVITESGTEHTFVGEDCQPTLITHWMPLPEPPRIRI